MTLNSSDFKHIVNEMKAFNEKFNKLKELEKNMKSRCLINCLRDIQLGFIKKQNRFKEDVRSFLDSNRITINEHRAK